MTRTTEFRATVSDGVRVVQPHLVLHARRRLDGGAAPGAQIGLVVSKAVGNAVQRHRVARQLRHVARAVINDLDPGDRLVIRALPKSKHAVSARLEGELRAALRRSGLRNDCTS